MIPPRILELMPDVPFATSAMLLARLMVPVLVYFRTLCEVKPEGIIR